METIKAIDKKLYTLITGASAGLGKSMAIECAEKGMNLILVALPNERLDVFRDEIIQKYEVDAAVYETDLMDENAIHELADWALSNYQINMLINNAGIGGTKAFEKASLEYIDSIILLNIRALALLTRLFLPELKKHKKAYVLNVASMASFSPIAYKTVYPASKAFVLSFSRGLYQELKKTSVFVSVITPGPMITNLNVKDRIANYGGYTKWSVLSPERTARIAIRQLLKRDSLIIPGFFNMFNWLLMRIIPIWIRLPMMSKAIFKKEVAPTMDVNVAYSYEKNK
ncbi:MAG: SDR family NAD(P)-dependent oxidoreductase [Bacteroidetes bacterium]|nr:SDR family NAD(P)-dependent oxidoreductase [Bacteroidota bacterium]